MIHRRPGPLVALALALAPSAALADGISAYLQPEYDHVDTRSTDSTGRTTQSSSDELLQQYVLGLSQTLAPLLHFDANGTFNDQRAWTTQDQVPSRSDSWSGSGSARLHIGPPVLGGDLSYQRSEDSTGSSLSPATLHEVNEAYSLHLGWHPADMPDLDVLATRGDNYDVGKQYMDVVSDDVLTTLTYNGWKQLRVQYSVEYQKVADQLHASTTTSLLNAGRLSYADSFDGGRTSVQANYDFMNRLADTSTAGVGGMVSTQQLPAAGLSLVDQPTTLPQTDTLQQNGLLVDGKTDVSAGINLGWSIGLAGDTNARELGVQFSDPTTQLNTVYVYVSQTLPLDVSSAFTFTAWTSDDNVNWTSVPLAAATVFNTLLRRFEVTLAKVQARYVKLITYPIAPAVSTDRRYSDIFVTELQTYLVVPAESVRGRSSLTSQDVSVALRRQLFSEPLVAYDFAANGSYSAGNASYTIQNGVSFDKALESWLRLSSRFARMDSGIRNEAGPSEHNGAWQYSASLVSRPLDTLTQSFTYNGQLAQDVHGSSAFNAVTFVNRASLYRGVDFLVSAGYTQNYLSSGAVSSGPQVVATASLTPNKVVTLSSTYTYSGLHQVGGGLPESELDDERLDGSVSITPFRALFLSASVQRVIKGARPTTLASASASFTPFPDGDLLLRSSYTDSLDTSLDARTQLGTAGLRWTISTHAYVDVNYTLLDAAAPEGTTQTKTFTASLSVQL